MFIHLPSGNASQISLMPEPATLKRSINLPLLILYGLGTTIGAGIYSLTGKVAGEAGMLAPWAFLLAALLALFTAFSYAEMCARYPRAAGAAVYVSQGLAKHRLGVAVGLLVILAACVSSAALMRAFVAHLSEFHPLPPEPVLIAMVLLIVVTAAWGITESVIAAALITLIEVGGLLLVVFAAGDSYARLPERLAELTAIGDSGAWAGIFGASLLAFYAFLGFEDMVNLAEEVRDVRRTMPLAIAATLVITAVLYVALALAAVLTVTPHELEASGAPLALVFERTGASQPALIIAVIALFAIVNGVLVQIILAARVMYGLSIQRALPAWLDYVHPATQTPLPATVLAGSVVLLLALWFPLTQLAQTTSVITLVIFALVNLSLLRIKLKEPAPSGVWQVPAWIPAAGFVINLGFVLYGLTELLSRPAG